MKSSSASNCSITLFVNGNTFQAEALISRVRSSLSTIDLPKSCLTVVDVAKDTDQATRAAIKVTPTLLREIPLPQKKVWGDFSSLKKIESALKILLSSD